uniref:Constituent protein n=3 Tax=unclassified bacterial viruses TaxID=12333 RepID=A0AAU6VZF1_9VIRU
MSYNPQIPPQKPEELTEFISDEFLRVAQALNNSLDGLYEVRHQIPARVKQGLVVYFDGTDANPLGTGQEGLYRYGSGGWVYIG